MGNEIINNMLDGAFVLNSLIVILLMFVVFGSLFGMFKFVDNVFLLKYTIILISYGIQGYFAKSRT